MPADTDSGRDNDGRLQRLIDRIIAAAKDNPGITDPEEETGPMIYFLQTVGYDFFSENAYRIGGEEGLLEWVSNYRRVRFWRWNTTLLQKLRPVIDCFAQKCDDGTACDPSASLLFSECGYVTLRDVYEKYLSLLTVSQFRQLCEEPSMLPAGFSSRLYRHRIPRDPEEQYEIFRDDGIAEHDMDFKKDPAMNYYFGYTEKESDFSRRLFFAHLHGDTYMARLTGRFYDSYFICSPRFRLEFDVFRTTEEDSHEDITVAGTVEGKQILMQAMDTDPDTFSYFVPRWKADGRWDDETEPYHAFRSYLASKQMTCLVLAHYLLNRTTAEKKADPLERKYYSSKNSVRNSLIFTNYYAPYRVKLSYIGDFNEETGKYLIKDLDEDWKPDMEMQFWQLAEYCRDDINGVVNLLLLPPPDEWEKSRFYEEIR